MTTSPSPGYVRRLWTACGRLLKRGVLGRSTQAYMDHLADAPGPGAAGPGPPMSASPAGGRRGGRGRTLRL